MQGERVWVDTGDLGQLISYEEVLVAGGYDLNLVPFTPTLVVDCGAHIGFFTRLAAARYAEARLLAFEPHPGNCVMLRRQLGELGKRVSLHQAAVSLEDGESWFAAECSNAGQLAEDQAARGWRVAVFDLRQVITAEGNEPLLLKLDVEGEERRIVPAVVSVLPPRCAVFFETHHGEAGWESIAGVLLAARFEVRLLRQRGQFCDGFALRH